MQSKKYVQNPELPVFNIRRVQKKTAGLGKNLGDGCYLTPEIEHEKHEKITDFQNYSGIYQQNPEIKDLRREKQIILDQTVNEAIVNSKVYQDLKKAHLENKKKNQEHKKKIQQEIQAKKSEKKELFLEREKLEEEKKKYLDAIVAMKEKLEAVRENNDKYREALNSNGIKIEGDGEEAEYLSNLIMSMRFQAQYQHDIDPDQMTYEELLELEEKIGSVSRGLPVEVIKAILPKIQITQEILATHKEQQKCMVCISGFEVGEVKTILSNCKHQFHYQCMQLWLGKEKICPLCKQEILFNFGDLQNTKKAP